ncbi:MAG: VWA domain-containing protein [Lachnospiraceae bacterium]|nr:VWA domain-containing protein [Lachnospiraceae bacterium]
MRKKRKIWLCAIFASLAFLTFPSPVHAQTEDSSSQDKPLAPYFVIQSENAVLERFPLKETKVTTNIDGVIAETYVVQTYANEGKTPINASYVFPASTNVTIHGMKMIIGDNIVTAKIKEKEEAKEEFEEAKSEGKSASLLEQERPNVFHMDVANIMPGANVRIELHYTELIEPVDGTYQFVFPTVVGPRYPSTPDEKEPAKEGEEEAGVEEWVASPYLPGGSTPAGKYDITVNLSTGVPIAGLSCKSHQIKVTKDNDSTAHVNLANANDFAGNRDFILEYKLNGQDVNCGLMVSRGEDENYFLLMVQPPERCEVDDIPPREYIFALDISGSMSGYPLETAKDLIKNLVTNLRETDRFNLILFSDDTLLMSPESLAATTENVNAATKLIDEQKGGGGTELAQALKGALALPMDTDTARSIVIITDGYISGEKEIFEMINENLATTSFFPFGIGTSVNRYLIEGIAKTGQGESFVVTDADEAADTAERFRTYIESPVLTDIQVAYDGFDVYDVEPTSLPTLFAQRPMVIYGKWRGELTGTIEITGKNGKQGYQQKIPVSQIAPLEDNEAIRYLWARKKVERLTDYGLNEHDPDIKEEVTQIGLAYSMMTPYTSFIAVVDTIQNPLGKSADVDQPLPLPLKVSDLAVGYRIGSEPGDFLIPGTILLILFINILSYWKRKRKISFQV